MIISLSVPYVLLMWPQRLESNIPLSPSFPSCRSDPPEMSTSLLLSKSHRSLETTSSWTLFSVSTLLICSGGFVVIQCSNTQFWKIREIYKKLLLLMVPLYYSLANPINTWKEFSFYINTHFDSVPFTYQPALPNIPDIKHA